MITLLGRARDALTLVHFNDWSFYAGLDAGGGTYLRVVFKANCSATGEAQQWQSRKWPLHDEMDHSDIIRTAFKAVMTAVEHETRESFKYMGRPIFGPHTDVGTLWLHTTDA